MKGYLSLSGGETLTGKWLNAEAKHAVQGEIAFYRGETGYEQALHDPAYQDKIIVFTYPLIGNYGITEADFIKKKPLAAGVVVYETVLDKYHYTAEYTLQEYLEKWGIPLLSRIDTRAVARKASVYSEMNGRLAIGEYQEKLSFTNVKTHPFASLQKGLSNESKEDHGGAVAYA